MDTTDRSLVVPVVMVVATVQELHRYRFGPGETIDGCFIFFVGILGDRMSARREF